MADPTSGDPSENEANVDLKGVIKDLQDEIKALNALLKTFGQGIQNNNKVTKMGVKDHLALIKAQGDMVKSNADYKKSLQNSVSTMDLFTGMLTKGVTPMLLFSTIGKKIGGLTAELDNMKAAAKDFAAFEDASGIYSEKSDEFANAKQEDKDAYLAKQARAIESAATYEKVKGGKGKEKMDGALSSMKEFAEKHKTGMLIGAGSAFILISILKKALSASPMFQQMMKLLNFGIMMVLRPIGDFFGFLFRPILIMLLRKFIIPWYTKMMPVMMKMGDLIGKKLAGAFEALAAGDVAGAFAILFKDVDFKKILGDAFASLKTWIVETDWDAVWVAITTALGALGTGLWEHVIKPIGEALYDELVKIEWDKAIWDTIKLLIPVLAVSDFIAGIFGVGNNKWANEWGRALGTWFSDGLEEAKTDWSTFWTDAYTWLTGGMTDLIVDWQSILDNFLDWLNPFTDNSAKDTSNSDIKDNVDTQSVPFVPKFERGAMGMHITEPIMGIGRSGRGYLMGEAGNETLIPDSQLGGGGNITINIQNMSGSREDLYNLRRIILDVIQESSARRGRA